MACPFCATGQGGLTRNLSTAEILEQVRAAAVTLREQYGDRLSNIVFMGMGEPLANYARVVAAVQRITAMPPEGFGISARSVTVSTVGLAPATPASSPTNVSESRWRCRCTLPTTSCATPWYRSTSRWKVREVLDAARYYADVTGRRVVDEYALIREINDQPCGGPTCSARNCIRRCDRWRM